MSIHTLKEASQRYGTGVVLCKRISRSRTTRKSKKQEKHKQEEESLQNQEKEEKNQEDQENQSNQRNQEENRPGCGLSKCGNIAPTCSHCSPPILLAVFLIASIAIVCYIHFSTANTVPTPRLTFLQAASLHIVQHASRPCSMQLGLYIYFVSRTFKHCTNVIQITQVFCILSFVNTQAQLCLQDEHCTDVLVCRNRC